MILLPFRGWGFYYRKDHLGNIREVWNGVRKNYSNQVKELASTRQRTQYYPSGLPWAESFGAAVQKHKYNGKEFIEMHGYDTYDIVWRQYYPAIARFQTPDPEAEKFYYLSSYTMCNNNMVLNTDPDGRIFETLWDVYNVATGVVSLAKNVASGNVVDAVLDAVGIVADVAAVVAPGIPGGAGAAIKAYRAGDKVVDVVKTADKVSDAKKTYQTSLPYESFQKS